MIQSIVNIESAENSSFGTGFIIAEDEVGHYVLTCKHVLDDVITPVIEDVPATIVTVGDFIDMAVIHVKNVNAKPLPLEINSCRDLKVEIIGFSHFNQTINQKKHIKATLFKDEIELHSTEDERFYNVKKIESTEGYTFERGNSGSPVLCQKTKKVIAILSNKEGSNLGYAIDIKYLEEVWSDLPSNLIAKRKPSFIPKEKEIVLVKEEKKSFLFYLISFSLLVAVAIGIYLFFQPKESPKPSPYHVVNIRVNDTLNVRTGKGRHFFRIGELPYNAKDIEVISCSLNDKNNKWCNIKYGNIQGWVHANYIGQ